MVHVVRMRIKAVCAKLELHDWSLVRGRTCVFEKALLCFVLAPWVPGVTSPSWLYIAQSH